MAQDEIGATKLLAFQNEVIAEVGLNDREQLRRKA